MPFPSHLQGLNLVDPSPYESQPSISDDDLARTLALWTNVDFSYDDGGIGLESAQKLLEQDAAQAAGLERGQRSTRDIEGGLARREHHSYQPSTTPNNGHFGHQHHNQVQEQDHSSSSSFFGHQQGTGGIDPVQQQQNHQQEEEEESDPSLDPFGFNSTLFALHQQATVNAALAASPGSILPPVVVAPRFTNSYEQEEARPSNKRKNMSRSESLLSSTESTTPLKNDNNDEVLAPEDDKRKRNTAASARFRQKKKEREQALEKTSKELQNRCALLEREVETLRRENGWLKTIVLGNGGGAPTN
ncbi:hypothetical protein BDY24DRAFT_370723 [Mrakia frigida]|uniref:Met4p n=1 Tax=Mrakia frigida TaxID=29902 RepID=UPI003FCBF502